MKARLFAPGMKARWFPPLVFSSLAGLAASMTMSVALTSIFLGLTIGLALLDRLTGPVLGWRRTPLDEPLAVFLSLTLLSALSGINPPNSLSEMKGTWSWFIYYGYVWYAADERRLRRIFTAIFIPAAVIALFGIVQHFTGLHIGRHPMATTAVFSRNEMLYLVRGTFAGHQTFSNVYFLIFCLVFSQALVPAPRRRRLLLAALASLVAIALFFTYTRGIWLATVAAVLVITFLRSRRAFAVMAAAMALLVALLLLIPSTYRDRARSIVDLKVNEHRLILWQTSWAMLREYPLTGIGPDNYYELQEKYLHPNVGKELRKSHAHNVYLHLAVERGIFALAAFAWLIWVILRMGLSSAWRLRGEEGFRLAALRGASAGVIGFLIDGFFQYNFGAVAVISLFFLLVAVITVLRTGREEGCPSRAAAGG